MKILITTLKLIVVLSLLLPITAQAQILPACTATGNCGICDFVDTFVNIARWFLGFAAAAALLLMIWHGYGWLTSGGSKERVESSRKGLVATIVGILIIVLSWQIINIVIVFLISPPGERNVNLFGNNMTGNNMTAWYQYCSKLSRGNICQGRGDGSPCEGGYFCLSQTCIKTGFDLGSCSVDPYNRTHTDPPVQSACEYWKYFCPDKMGGFNPYTEYGCRPESQCDPYEDLGSSYCRQAGQSCCQARSQP